METPIRFVSPADCFDVQQRSLDMEQKHQKAFNAIKNYIARNPSVFTDTSNLQLGNVISQKGKPIALYSRKLNPAQTRYTTTEKKLLAIVQTLKELKTFSLGKN